MDKLIGQAATLATNGYVLETAQEESLKKFEDLLTETQQSLKNRSQTHRSRRRNVRKFLTNLAEHHIELVLLCMLSFSISGLAEKHAQLLVQLPARAVEIESVPLCKLAEEKIRKYFPANRQPSDGLSKTMLKRPLAESEDPDATRKRPRGAESQEHLSPAVELGNSQFTILLADSSDVWDMTDTTKTAIVEEIEGAAESNDGGESEDSDSEDSDDDDKDEGDNVAVARLWDNGQIPATSDANVYALTGMDAIQVISHQRDTVVRLTIPKSGSLQPFMLVSCAWRGVRKFIRHRERLL